ncbi:hypothetical protein GHH61_23540 [Salmonella enterica]|nr:hypothetical protein [Salmonella enterica]
MKNLRLVVLAIMAVSILSGCAVNPNASDYEVCKALSGDTFYSASDAAQIMQQRAANGTATLSPSDCAAVAQGESARWAGVSQALNQSAMQQQALQAQQQAAARAATPVQTSCSAFGNTVNCTSY